ncbi:NUDIX hydrolase [Polyangium spumosum]|uniref:GDP-mannose pyrophosphatase n=1 Tax=Polyangium spumosum TaxID=889282 RepID=A0A6N7PSZ4_9BACT|nr:NUDIX hydrolase [Polyangium spumosum]MRG94767.1 NUDIX domain-containing protein [Polyangium spumosum]
MPLPQKPRILLAQEQDAEPSSPAFLRVQRVMLRASFPDGERSEPFSYDIVLRDRLDAVVIAAHFRDERGVRNVYLRSCVRPPVALRNRNTSPIPERDDLGNLWELPAGLVEVDEQSPEGLLLCATRELHEELGFEVDPRSLLPLGPSSFPAPGMVGERHFFFHVVVDPSRRVTPTEDGSVLERKATIAALPLDEALALARQGLLEDEKTELALRRLAELST